MVNTVKIEPRADSARLLPPLQRAIDANVRSGGSMGSFVRLHLDATLLAEYESPGFDEFTAVALDDLPLSQDAKMASLPLLPLPPRIKMEETRDARAATSGYMRVTPPLESTVGWMLTAMREPQGDMRCRYRKDKCGATRAMKKNGSLHSYCEFHRQRSVINQRKFDKKKREAQAKHLCRGCVEGGACHDRAQASQRGTSRQSTRTTVRSTPSDVREKTHLSDAVADTNARGGEEFFLMAL